MLNQIYRTHIHKISYIWNKLPYNLICPFLGEKKRLFFWGGGRSFARERKDLPGKGKCKGKGRIVIMKSRGNCSWDLRRIW